MKLDMIHLRGRLGTAATSIFLILMTAPAYAAGSNMPWEQPLQSILDSVQGPVAKIMAVIIIPFWFILKKAGFSSWLSLINLVPFGTLILLYILAFAEWKVIPAPQVAWQPPPPYPPQA